MARRVLLTVGLGLLGVLAAASIGYASYLVSRDEVGLPVTQLEQAPRDVVPIQARTQPRTTSTKTATVDDSTNRSRTSPTTSDDSSGRGRGRGRGGDDSSGKGSGGGGDFDDD